MMTVINSPLFFRKERDRFGRTHYRELRTGRYVAKPIILRLSTTLNFVVHGDYKGAIIQTWHTSEPSDDMVRDQVAEMLRMVESYLGVPQAEWWFSVRVGMAVQEVEEVFPEWRGIETKRSWRV